MKSHHLLFAFISQFIDVIFQEQKIKEGLYMMGLKDGIFHLSWFITYALQVNRFFFHRTFFSFAMFTILLIIGINELGFPIQE